MADLIDRQAAIDALGEKPLAKRERTASTFEHEQCRSI